MNPPGSWTAPPVFLSFSLLKAIVEQTGLTVIVASHDANVVKAADLVFDLKDGKLVDIHMPQLHPLAAESGEFMIGQNGKIS